MMDEKVHKSISDAVTDGGGRPDGEIKSLVDNDEEASRYFEDINALEQQLRSWGFEEPPRQYWKSFASRLTPQLGDEAPKSEEDPLAPPAPDESEVKEGQDDPEEASEKSGEPEEEEGLGALAALAGRSTLPPAKAFEEDSSAESEDGDVIDLGLIKAETEEKEKSADDHAAAVAPLVGAAGSGATPALASPSQASAAPQKKSYTSFFLAAALIASLAVVAFLVFGPGFGGDDSGQVEGNENAVAQAPTQDPAQPVTLDPEPSPENPPEVTEPPVAGGDPVDLESVEGSSLAETNSGGGAVKSGSRLPRAARSPGALKAAPNEVAPSAASEPTPPSPTPVAPAKTAKASSALDELLEGAVKGKNSSSSAVQAAVGNEGGDKLPAQPSRSQVRRAMGSVAGQVMACRSMIKTQTRVNATVTVASSGSVTSASVSGGPGDVQACVKRAVQRARFPQFSNATFSVTYPFVLSPPE